MRALLVEDVDINRKMASIMLTKAGVKISEACDGKDALEYLENTSDTFDVVLMDVQMPVMDGLTATRLIRQHPRFGELPVIAMHIGSGPGRTGYCKKTNDCSCYRICMHFINCRGTLIVQGQDIIAFPDKPGADEITGA